MIGWIDRLEFELPEPFSNIYPILKNYWVGDEQDFDEVSVKESLWSWIDKNGGPGSTNEKNMNVARMILCLAYKNHEDIEELKDIGFFDDLLANYGIPRDEINRANFE